MKYGFPLALALFIPAFTSAQVTITSADLPDAGDSVRVSYAASIGAADQTLTDTNYVWDYSFLTPAAQERIEFVTPTAFPMNLMSDMGVTNYSPDSLPVIGSIPTNFTDYYRNSNSGFRQVGSTFDYPPIGSFSIPIIYSSPDYVYRFPLNYGNLDSCDAIYALTIPGIGYIGQERHRVNYVDGWGTLITPIDTYQVVRVRSIVDAVDTISFDTSNQTGYSIMRPRQVQYKWLAPGMKLPVLEIGCQIIGNAEVVTSVTYQDTLRDSLFQVTVQDSGSNALRLATYPNPAHDQLTIAYAQAGSGDLTFCIHDLQGKIICTEMVQNPGSEGFLQLDVSGLTPGIYLISVTNNTGKTISKIVIN